MLRIENVTKVFNLTGNIEDKRIALNDISIESLLKDVTIVDSFGS